jgi:hypothetical protein
MDSQQTNLSIVNQWAYRPAPTRITLHTSFWQASNIVGDNGSGTGVITGGDAYTAAAYPSMPVSYTHGEICHGRVLNSNTTTSVTLDVGSRGPKTVWFDYGQPPVASGTNPNTRLITTNQIYTFIYDSFYDQWFVNTVGAMMGHPIEYLVELCNVTNLPGWFNIPVYASDDYITQWANYLVAHYNPSLIYFEYGNEIWNTAAGFIMTNRLAKWGDVTFSGIGSGSGANYSGYYGYRMAQAAAIIRGVFNAAGKGSKVKIILASQGSSGDNASTLTNVIENKRFKNISFPALSGANAPINSADYVAYALYYGGTTLWYTDAVYTANVGTVLPGLKTAADNYNSGVTSQIQTAFNFLKEDMTTNNPNYTSVVGNSGRFANWNTLAASYGKQVIMYEFNQQFDTPSASWCTTNIGDSTYGDQTGKINALMLAFLASPQYAIVVERYMSAFFSFSQSLAMNLFGMCTANPWLTFPKIQPTLDTALGGDTTQTPFANWAAHSLDNNGKRRLMVTTT